MKRALVIGCATGVWSEVKSAQALAIYDTIYCVKMAGIDWLGGFFWWVTLHPDFMEDYTATRKQLGHHSDYRIIGPLVEETAVKYREVAVDRRTSWKWPGYTNRSGSSGLFGVKAALEDGHDRIVIAGIPMEAERGHFKRGKPWDAAVHYRRAWEDVMPLIHGKVKSASGWTAEKLGIPTREWLNDA